MPNKHKVLLLIIGSLLSLTAFIMLTGTSDKDSIMDGYRSTVNGYYTKSLSVTQTVKDAAKEQSSAASTGTSGGTASAPSGIDVTEWRDYYTKCQMSDTRRKLVEEGLKVVERGTVYHQIHSASWSPNSCYASASCDGQIYANAGAFDFNTQASYKSETPYYLDCSFFIKHCYYIAGLSMSAGDTGTMRPDGSSSTHEFTEISVNELLPGDIAIKPGHVSMYAGKDASGAMYWLEMSCHSADAQFSSYVPTDKNSSYKYCRFGALKNDTTFVDGR